MQCFLPEQSIAQEKILWKNFAATSVNFSLCLSCLNVVFVSYEKSKEWIENRSNKHFLFGRLIRGTYAFVHWFHIVFYCVGSIYELYNIINYIFPMLLFMKMLTLLLIGSEKNHSNI